MMRIKIIGLLMICLFSTLACATITTIAENSDVPTIESYAEVEPLPATLAPVPESQPSVGSDAFCPNITAQIMEIATYTEETESPSDLGVRDDDEMTYLVTYLIENDQIVEPYYEDVPAELADYQNDSAAHEEIWAYFSNLISVQNREAIAEFAIMTDGQDNVLASVIQTYDDPNYWTLEVDILDTEDYYNLTYTLVHEYGHVLTLGPDQVPPSLAVFNNPEDNDIYLSELSACANYFPGEGCANPDSYINNFYSQFWADIYDEWNAINLEEDDDAYYEKLDAFYYKYEDRFVIDYASTKPEEDIAESWSFFVLGPKPDSNSVAEEKILFFYDYPELVELRAQILNNLCGTFPE